MDLILLTGCMRLLKPCLFLFATLLAQASPAVSVIVPERPNPLEKFAAAELCRYLHLLFGIEVAPAAAPSPRTTFEFRVGSRDRLNLSLPALSEQGVLLKPRPDGAGLVVAGGSPAATLWAVYELVERWGVHYLLHGDIVPPRRKFQAPRYDVILEPRFRVRQWRVVNELAVGPASWGIADYQPVLDQLAKLRFNRILAYVWPHQPFLDYQVRSIARRSATTFFGFRFPITDDMPGRRLFGSAREFWNPDLPPPDDYRKFHEAARDHLRAIMQYAGSRGMSTVLGLSATEFPREFAPLLRQPEQVRQVGQLTVVPGADAGFDDPALHDLASAVLTSAIDTYPDADFLDLGMQEWRQWTSEFERAWDTLDRKYHLDGRAALARLLAKAQNRKGFDKPSRAVAEVKGDIITLALYDRLLEDDALRKRRVVLDGVAEELVPHLSRMAPWASETLNNIDYTPSRILQRTSALDEIGRAKLPAVMIDTLHDDNVGVLPQLATDSLHRLTLAMKKTAWTGFSTRYWLIGDHDPTVEYLAQAAWHDDTTPSQVYRRQAEAACGTACVEPVSAAFAELERATSLLEMHGIGLTFPVREMVQQHWKPGLPKSEYRIICQYYEAALRQLERVRTKPAAGDRHYVPYYVGRLKFGIAYFRMLDAVAAGASAEAAGDRRAAAAHAAQALALSRESIEAYAAVARDQSDRGTIAVLDEFVYRWLKQKAASLAQKAA